MPHNRRISPRRQLALDAELLERRSLMSGTSPRHQDVEIQVPSAYISQHSSRLDVTLVRTAPSGRSETKGSITVNFSATSGPGQGVASASNAAEQQFTPVNESITLSGGPIDRDGRRSHQFWRGKPRARADSAHRNVLAATGEGK